MGRLQAQKAAGAKRRNMSKAVVRPFAEIVQRRVRREAAFGPALLEEAAQCMLNGELAVARNLVRDVIKGSIGYAELSRCTGTPEKSLVRMFGPNGNPTAANLSRIFAHLQHHEGVSLQVRSVAAPSARKSAAL
jgi:DNA-binding phage protein